MMKKFLLSLFVGFLGFLGFSNAGSYTFSGIINSDTGIPMFVIPQYSFSTNIVMDCYFTGYNACDGEAGQISNYNVAYFYGNYYKQQKQINNDGSVWSIPCSDSSSVHISYDFSTFTSSYGALRGFPYIQFSIYAGAPAPYNITYSCTFNGDYIISPGGGSSSCPDCPSCDNTAHMGIYQGGGLIQGLDSNTGFYSLYLSDGLDFSITPTAEGQNIYITGYNFSGSGDDFTGDLQFSNIYINDILHPGRQNIFVNIPDYITWDYNLTGDDFNIYIGSGYDQDYINSVIDINSYRPSSGDFTNIFVSGLTLVMPYIVILLFIIFIWKLIKRIFK